MKRINFKKALPDCREIQLCQTVARIRSKSFIAMQAALQKKSHNHNGSIFVSYVRNLQNAHQTIPSNGSIDQEVYQIENELND